MNRLLLCGFVCALLAQDKESKLGELLLVDELARSHPLTDPAAQAYLERVGAKLTDALPYRLPYRFFLIDDDRNPLHEPFTLPGANLFVPAALIRASETEAEFAAMLAHAMAHISARHFQRPVQPPVATIPLIFTGSWAASPGSLLPRAFVAQWPALELEADRLASTALAESGYDPQALRDYLARVQTRDYEGLPPRAERLAALSPKHVQ
jgi:predicted Zn-dependent protease